MTLLSFDFLLAVAVTLAVWEAITLIITNVVVGWSTGATCRYEIA